MGFEEYDDYEQSERVQQWLRQNGVSIIVGIVLGLVLIFGWQQWKVHRASRHAEASARYQQFQTALGNDKLDDADTLLKGLQKDFSSSPYAVFAAALEAQYQVDHAHLDKAEPLLLWAHRHAGRDTLKALMGLRLARVQLGRGDAKAALATLDAIHIKAFDGITQELRGDALVKLGRDDDARTAYQHALSAMDKNAPQYGMTQMKLDNLAPARKQGA